MTNEHGLFPLQLWEMAKNLVEDFQETIVMDFPPKQPIYRGWSAPPPGSFKGVLLAQEMELSNVIFEINALSIIQATSQDISGSEMGHLIQGIQLAKASFNCCSFHQLKRDYNRVAHELAQFAKCNHANQTWKGVSPLFVAHLI
ncbi:hypothetical protein SO802_010745 [Lithocarpus litseifolius]|uniref:RNase H type-1 domain-containing protein n=1 Tax=Lithocarpus litseifolius TaxID=425828 RepID=A0AAW2DF23_9ROSI